MKTLLQIKVFSSLVIAASLVLALVSVSDHSPAIAQDSGKPTSQEPSGQSPPNPPASADHPKPSNTKPEQPSQPNRDDDRVYIEDIYPEYCRSYFLRRDYVSLFEYREGMYRCLYGNDRWHF